MKIRGTNGDDHLFGSEGRDAIRGGRGADVIDGNLGRDKLYGGPGKDTFILTYADATDRIMDFDPEKDTLMVFHSAIMGQIFPEVFIETPKGPSLIGTAPQAPLEWFLFEGGRFAATSPGFAYNDNNGRFWYDYDGGGVFPALHIANLPNGIALSEANIILA